MDEIKGMKISMRFGLDKNQNNKIEKEEIVKFSELSSQDQDENKTLKGRELDGVYFEYGDDVWLEGDRTHVIRKDDYTQRIRLKEVKLDPPAIDMKVNISM